jgi:hypothetical protein
MSTIEAIGDGEGHHHTDGDAAGTYAPTALPSPPSPTLPKAARKKNRRVLKKDQRVRRAIRKAIEIAPHLDEQVFTPILEGFARVSILFQDAYESIRNQSLIGPDGELRSSIEVVRRLAETQARLAERLGLTPGTLRTFSREKTVLDLDAMRNDEN